MDNFIWPDIFGGDVKAFFTVKPIGIDAEYISRMFSLKKEYIFMPVQKHTDNILVIERDLHPQIADAVITNRKHLLIGVQVADCVPILMLDRSRMIIGAIHAGWRGTAAQIVKKTIRKITGQYGSSPEDILFALGPSIRWCCYNVGSEVKSAVCKATGRGEYCRGQNGAYFIDLLTANKIQILSSAVPEKNIWSSNECTYCLPDKYYSFRYTKEYNGSQGGYIGIL
jgi:hypothetical protein